MYGVKVSFRIKNILLFTTLEAEWRFFMNDEIDTLSDDFYVDIANNVRKVKHTSVLSDEGKREIESKIAEDLIKIFSK